MSTNSECQHLEYQPDQWFLFLEDKSCGQRWDWREAAHCHGPFPTEELSDAYLRKHYPNPGGGEITAFDPAAQPDAELDSWISKATPVSKEEIEGLKETVAWEAQPEEVKEAERLRRMALVESLRRSARLR